MVDGQIRTFDVTDAAVIRAFSKVPREVFLPRELTSLAYSDAVLTLPGPSRRAMIQPMHLARLIQGASVQPTDRVLVIAGGTGYASAILTYLAADVVSLEADADMTAAAATAAQSLSLTTLRAVTGPLDAGYPAQAPYDVILVPGTVETDLRSLFDQLSPTGRLLALQVKSGEASRRSGKAIRFERIARDISERPLFDATAPMIGEFRQPEKFVF